MGKYNIPLGGCLLRPAIFVMIAGIFVCFASGKEVDMHSVNVAPETSNLVARQASNDIISAALEEHNKRRSRHGSPNLVWSNSIQKQAQKYADYLASNDKFEHSSGTGLGENLAANGVSDKAGAVRMALVQWYDNEEPKYDYNKPGFSMETGHFTQVVWRSTKELGVGIAWNPKKRWWVIVGNYSPAGNMGGQFPQNVARPK